MLVLTRRLNEAVVIDGGIRVTVLSIRGSQIRLGFEAPGPVRVLREELCAAAETDGAVRPRRPRLDDTDLPAATLRPIAPGTSVGRSRRHAAG